MLQILLLALVEIFKAMFLMVPWKEVAARFMTRLVITGLQKLAKWRSNDVTAALCNDIILSLQGKRLTVADSFTPPSP